MLTLTSGLIIYKPRTGETVENLEFALARHQSTYDFSVKSKAGIPRRRKLALIEPHLPKMPKHEIGSPLLPTGRYE
jgi:hypothetical protein